MRLIFNTIFNFFSNFRNEFSICFSNFCNKIIKICFLSVLNFSKIILFKYCRLKFYFYLTQFLKYFSFILYTSKYFYNWLGLPWLPLGPPLNISSGYGPGVNDNSLNEIFLLNMFKRIELLLPSTRDR